MKKIKHHPRSVRRAISVRSKLHGTAQRPRLSVYRSNIHISLQLIDDDSQKTLFGVSDLNKKIPIKGTKTQRAVVIAKKLAEKMKSSKINKIVFDRGSYRYHGRVKAVADILREEGLDF